MKLTAMKFKNYTTITFIEFIIVAFVVSAITKIESVRLSTEEDSVLNEQLKAINKPAIKSFKTRYGDIVDCIEIYKQLAFDHPLLKNHTIQLKPPSNPYKRSAKDSIGNTPSSQAKLDRVHCPKGSVPIKRVSKEDLIVDKYLRSLATNYNTNYSGYQTLGPKPRGVGLQYSGDNKGASGLLNTWSVADVQNDQHSSAQIGVVNGHAADFDAIKVGWIVFPEVFKDRQTRLFTYWLGELIYGTKIKGCYNLLCPGFVQVSDNLYVGSVLSPLSTFGGTQTEIDLSLHQDTTTRNWWLRNGYEEIGYFPGSIFHFLIDGAAHASWGGEAGGPRNELSAPIGSSHFPYEGYGKAAYIKNIEVHKYEFADVKPVGAQTYTTDPTCYDIEHGVDKRYGYHYILFGGPGNCKDR